MNNKVVLVDENDNQIGIEDKLKAHQNGGKLHRAFSVLIFNSKGELMLQQRAKSKYHGGGLWTNTVCSHPAPGESVIEAARRRLEEEMGLEIVNLEEKYSFIYRKEFDNGLTEHELDHVICGLTENEPELNPDEADDWKWIAINDLKEDIKINPDKYTFWFKEIIKKTY